MLVLDGVYMTEEGDPSFVPASPLTNNEVEWAVGTVHRPVERLLRRRGLLDDPPEEDA
ncbi:MAG: HAMP domain-containing protein [Kiritimatiellia bacterium]|jgi:HAMP domain-containing protein